MRHLLILLLAGCAAEPRVEQKYCMERIDLKSLMEAPVINGKITPTCNMWCVGKEVGNRCDCRATCPCKGRKD